MPPIDVIVPVYRGLAFTKACLESVLRTAGQLPFELMAINDASPEAEKTSVEQTTELIQGRLDTLVGQLLGRRAAVTHRWAGIWGTTPDALPLVGRVPGREGVWIAAGYSGHGNVLGLVCGTLAADAVLGEERERRSLFDPARFG